MKAIRDNEVAAAGFGIDIWKIKFEVYVVTVALTSMIGGLIFLQKLRISPDAAFSVNDSTAFVIFIVVIGGIGTFKDSTIGTMVFFALRETLSSDFGTFYLKILGLMAIAVMLKAPNGIWGLVLDRALTWNCFRSISASGFFHTRMEILSLPGGRNTCISCPSTRSLIAGHSPTGMGMWGFHCPGKPVQGIKDAEP